MTATVHKTADTLVFAGTLDRDACPAAWKQAQPLFPGTRAIDLENVQAVDSAGLAMLAEIAGQCGGVQVTGAPTGLSELRAAYRLGESLDFAS